MARRTCSHGGFAFAATEAICTAKLHECQDVTTVTRCLLECFARPSKANKQASWVGPRSGSDISEHLEDALQLRLRIGAKSKEKQLLGGFYSPLRELVSRSQIVCSDELTQPRLRFDVALVAMVGSLWPDHGT